MRTPSSPPPTSSPPRARRPTRIALAVILTAVGGVWIGQGLGLIRSRSFMTDDPAWAWIGAAAVIVGVILLVRGVRIRRDG